MALSTDRSGSTSSGVRGKRELGTDGKTTAKNAAADGPPDLAASFAGLSSLSNDPKTTAPTQQAVTLERRPVVIPPPPWEQAARTPLVPPPLPVDSLTPLATPQPPPAPAHVPSQSPRSRYGWLLVPLLILLVGGTLNYLLRSPEIVSGPLKQRSRIGTLFANGFGGWFGKGKAAKFSATNAAPSPAIGSSLAAPVRLTQKVVGEVLAVQQRALAATSGTNDTKPAAATPTMTAPPPSLLSTDKTTPVVVDEEPETIQWPQVEVSALVGSGSRGSALINGDLLMVGEANAADVTLVQIEPQAALLEFKGQRRRVPVKRR